MRLDRRLVLLLPSLTLLVLSALGAWLWPPPPLEPRWAWPWWLLSGLATALALLGGAALLERLHPGFRATSARIERLVRDLRLRRRDAALGALLSGVAEELFFRGWLMGVAGLWVQALVFMLLHPAGRRGWSYTAYTGVAGLVLGALTLASGSLVPAVLAHVAVNLHGLTSASGGARRVTPPPAAVARPGGAAAPAPPSVQPGPQPTDGVTQRVVVADQREADVPLAGRAEGESGRERDAGGAGEPLGEGDGVASSRR